MPKTRAITVIISHQPRLRDWELVSLRQCVAVLGGHPMTLVLPDGMDTAWYREFVPEIPVDFVDRRWLMSYAMFASLKISPLLYERYREYDYILFYEPDAFVFSDQLDHWCAQGLDYIGAPWFEGFVDAIGDRIVGVGNGGFSLRRVEAHLEIARRHQREQFLFRGYRKHAPDKLRYAASLLAYHSGARKRRPYYIGPDYYGHEDFFWCMKVPARYPDFKIATVPQSMAFSFEARPRLLFERNAGRLPFGCHAWLRYDLDFWRPHIERFGHRLDPALAWTPPAYSRRAAAVSGPA